jgi:guanylate kinase
MEDFMNLPTESDEEYLNVYDLLKEYPDEKLLCIFCGCSGSGKSHFESIIQNYNGNDVFFKLPQVTTREPRENETHSQSNYYFVDEDTYEFIYKTLIARLEMYDNFYGTIPVFEKGKINTVIAAADAIEDIFECSLSKRSNTAYTEDNNTIDNVVPILIMFDIEPDNIKKDGIREGRDKENIQQERDDLNDIFEKYKDRCYFAKKYSYEEHDNSFALPTDIFSFVKNN